jgi:hypothetical protein
MLQKKSWVGVLVMMMVLSAVSSGFAGDWLHRGATDTTCIHSTADSLDHMMYPPYPMHMMMPDSLYCDIEEVDPHEIPCDPDSTMLAAYHVMFEDAAGQCMGENGMQFRHPVTIHFHPDHEEWDHEHSLMVKYWDEQGSQWVEIGEFTAADSDVISVEQENVQMYYGVFSPGTTASVDGGSTDAKTWGAIKSLFE